MNCSQWTDRSTDYRSPLPNTSFPSPYFFFGAHYRLVHRISNDARALSNNRPQKSSHSCLWLKRKKSCLILARKIQLSIYQTHLSLKYNYIAFLYAHIIENCRDIRTTASQREFLNQNFRNLVVAFDHSRREKKL